MFSYRTTQETTLLLAICVIVVCGFRDFSLAQYKSREFCIPMANEKTLLKIPQIYIVFPVNSTREVNSL